MKLLRLSLLPLVAVLCVGFDAGPADCQSLNLNTPASVHEGNNQALIDSFVGDHYYFFYAEPGRFHIARTWGNANEGFNVGGKPSFAAAFNPKTQGSVMTFKEGPNGTTYDGTVTQRTRVLIGGVTCEQQTGSPDDPLQSRSHWQRIVRKRRRWAGSYRRFVCTKVTIPGRT
jgi:hypothetical protein